MQGYATSGDVVELRNAAGAAIPMMQRHLAMAQGLAVMPPAPPPPPPPPPMPAPSPGQRGERG
jgi:hypothetical protein